MHDGNKILRFTKANAEVGLGFRDLTYIGSWKTSSRAALSSQGGFLIWQ